MEGESGDWNDESQRMRKFFWNESIERSWESCWKVALDRKKRRAGSKEKGSKPSMTGITLLVYNFDSKQTPRPSKILERMEQAVPEIS